MYALLKNHNICNVDIEMGYKREIEDTKRDILNTHPWKEGPLKSRDVRAERTQLPER